MGKLKNKNILITGGSHGIGRAMAEVFAREGANIFFTYYSDKAAAEQVAEKLVSYAVQVNIQQVELSSTASAIKLVQNAIETFGNIDVLVNNAGTLTRHSHFLEITEQDYDSVMNLNLKMPFILTQEAAKHMISQQIKGAILNISSVSSHIISSGLTHYECSKAAVEQLTRASAAAFAPHGIRVNAIAPGLVATHLNKSQREKNPEIWESRCQKIPLGRAGTSKEIAELALFLISPAADWMTGSIINYDGGQSVQ